MANDHGAAGTFRGVLAADEVAFDQDLLLQGGEVLQGRGVAVIHGRNGRHMILDLAKDFQPLGFFGPAGEGSVFEVAGKADAAAHHDFVVGAVAAEPLAGMGHDVVESHACSSCSIFWISSRKRAASS